MKEHRVYYGKFQTDHYFVEVKKNLFDEWSAGKIRNITHRNIVEWLIRERERKAKVILMTYAYIKRGCGDTVKLLKIIGRKGELTPR